MYLLNAIGHNEKYNRYRTALDHGFSQQVLLSGLFLWISCLFPLTPMVLFFVARAFQRDSSLRIRAATSFPRSPTSPAGPTHDGHPWSHGQAASSRDVSLNSRGASRYSGALCPMPPGYES